MQSSLALRIGLAFCCASLPTLPCGAADVQDIVRRGTAVIQTDWAADPDYAYVERDEVQKGEGSTSKTFQVVMVDGSEYRMPLAVNDKTLTPDQKKAELQKFRAEVQRRSNESPAARRERLEKYNKQEDENGATARVSEKLLL